MPDFKLSRLRSSQKKKTAPPEKKAPEKKAPEKKAPEKKAPEKKAPFLHHHIPIGRCMALKGTLAE